MHTAEKSLLLGAHPRINAGFVASCHPPRLGRTPAPSKAPRRRMITVAGSVPTQGPREPQPRPSILPAGKRQARVDLPALFLSVSADQLARSPGTVDDITAAVAGGATAVLLREGTSGGATKLYEAVIAVKEALRGRAALLVQDRTDIADAAGADGVLLSPAGLPTVVAKGMLQSGSALVGRAVADGDAAVQAAAEGASFVVVQTSGGSPTAEAVASARQQRSGASVPVLVELTSNLESGVLQGLLNAGANGILLDLDALSPVAVAATMEPQGTITEAAASLLQCLSQSVRGSSVHQNEEGGEGEGAEAGSMPVAQLSQLLSPGREEVVAAEKETLQRLLDFLASACPALEETSLLRDAVQQLDELFLVVVVGEFNSGKSAVINALLGRRVLAEGILPTTNEISVLKWADPADPEAERAEQVSAVFSDLADMADGFSSPSCLVGAVLVQCPESRIHFYFLHLPFYTITCCRLLMVCLYATSQPTSSKRSTSLTRQGPTSFWIASNGSRKSLCRAPIWCCLSCPPTGRSQTARSVSCVTFANGARKSCLWSTRWTS